MLPIGSDIGERLAAVLPTGIDAVEQGGLTSFVLIVVDGLGHANLAARKEAAPTLLRLPRKRIETVAPSTTGAALTSLMTGVLPGRHGLVGYRIRHPDAGLRTTLNEWDGIDDPGDWQRAEPQLARAASHGLRAIAVGRPEHATGGLTEAILRGAEYIAGKTIEDRFAIVSRVLRDAVPTIAYLYVNELDREAHARGAASDEWAGWLARFDSALDGFLRSLPGNVGAVITADHGIVDVAGHQQVFVDSDPALLRGVAEIGGEPRMRYLYLDSRGPGAAEEADALAAAWRSAERDRAWVATRAELVESGWLGPVGDGVADRIGDVVVAARKRVAYYLSTDEPRALAMVGQHGSFSEDERGVPLILAGALEGSSFARDVARRAADARGAV